jgi:hypothetical protein
VVAHETDVLRAPGGLLPAGREPVGVLGLAGKTALVPERVRQVGAAVPRSLHSSNVLLKPRRPCDPEHDARSRRVDDLRAAGGHHVPDIVAATHGGESPVPDRESFNNRLGVVLGQDPCVQNHEIGGNHGCLQRAGAAPHGEAGRSHGAQPQELLPAHVVTIYLTYR